MLEVRGIDNGIVIDHISSGKGLKIFNLMFSEIENPVVLLMNVESGLLGKKDIIKIENVFDVDLSTLGLIDQKITVNIIKNGQLSDKIKLKIPQVIKGGIKCQDRKSVV